MDNLVREFSDIEKKVNDAIHSLENINMMNQDYSDYESKPAPAGNQQLWVVHDEYMEKPVQRFEDVSTSPLADTVFSGDGPMTTAPTPDGMVKFIRDTLDQFKCPHPTQYVKVDDVARAVLQYLDYNEPYYLFVDSAVQLCQDNMQYTYRKKRTGEVFPPDRTEIFKVIGGWDFKPFRSLCDLIGHPVTQAILKHGHTPHPKVQNRTLTIRDTIHQMTTILWGSTPPEVASEEQSEDGLDAWIKDWMDSHYETVLHNLQFGPDRERVSSIHELPKIDLVMNNDRAFWKLATLAALGWIRSPFAMRFLIEYHQVYGSLLDWNYKENHCYIMPDTGGTAIVVEWEIFTLQHVNLIKNEPPGTCGRCQQQLHCSKYVNVRALTHKDCNCRKGPDVDPLDTNFYNHDFDCKSRTLANFQFACQKCLTEIVDMRSIPKCQRLACPNTTCPWHVGQNARIRELTRQRTLLLAQTHNND